MKYVVTKECSYKGKVGELVQKTDTMVQLKFAEHQGTTTITSRCWFFLASVKVYDERIH